MSFLLWSEPCLTVHKGHSWWYMGSICKCGILSLRGASYFEHCSCSLYLQHNTFWVWLKLILRIIVTHLNTFSSKNAFSCTHCKLCCDFRFCDIIWKLIRKIWYVYPFKILNHINSISKHFRKGKKEDKIENMSWFLDFYTIFTRFASD